MTPSASPVVRTLQPACANHHASSTQPTTEDHTNTQTAGARHSSTNTSIPSSSDAFAAREPTPRRSLQHVLSKRDKLRVIFWMNKQV